MRLISQKAFLLFVLSALACSDTGGPGAVRARFDLDNIDGRSLPTYPAATPGLTPTILSNTVVLNDDGHAAIIEHRTQWNGVDVTDTTTYTYTIAGNEIQFAFSPPCPPNALCIAPPRGTIFGPLLSLEMGHVNSYIIHYNYRLATS